ncbi:MAG: type II toxin-antitoxin system VapC family toxin, partial [Polaromonas sp.]|nr:type II toxin-antitoxin system VapC family toxin [Polaromonas sp.]
CIWIEALADTPTGAQYKTLLSDTENLLTSTLVIFELRKWVVRTLDESTADQVMVLLLDTTVVAPDASISLHAAELAALHRLHAIDALIYATALSQNATLVTCDAHFKDLPQVEYAAKRS